MSASEDVVPRNEVDCEMRSHSWRGSLWDPTLIGEKNECQRGHWALVDCEIPHWLERETSVSEDVVPRNEVDCEMRSHGWRESLRSHIDWRDKRVSARTLGPENGWIVRSHIDWREERVSVRTWDEIPWLEGELEIPHWLERGTSVSEDIRPRKEVDCKIPHWLERATSARDDIWPQKEVDYEIPHWLKRETSVSDDVVPQNEVDCEIRSHNRRGSLWDPTSIRESNKCQHGWGTWNLRSYTNQRE